MKRTVAKCVAVPLAAVACVLLGFWPTAVQPVDDTLSVSHEPGEFGPAHYFPENDTVRFWVTDGGSERAFEPFETYACWEGKAAARQRLSSLLDSRFLTGDSGVTWRGDFDRFVLEDASFRGPTRWALRHSLPDRVTVSVTMFDRTTECSFPVVITRPSGDRPSPGTV